VAGDFAAEAIEEARNGLAEVEFHRGLPNRLIRHVESGDCRRVLSMGDVISKKRGENCRMLGHAGFRIALIAIVVCFLLPTAHVQAGQISLNPISTSTEILIDPGSSSQQVVQDPAVSRAPSPFVGQGVAGNQSVSAFATSTRVDKRSIPAPYLTGDSYGRS
jgi:hypothetical protein